jgi:hypothetical protein
MEHWSDAFREKPNTPTLQYSDTPFLSILSEVSLGSPRHRNRAATQRSRGEGKTMRQKCFLRLPGFQSDKI